MSRRLYLLVLLAVASSCGRTETPTASPAPADTAPSVPVDATPAPSGAAEPQPDVSADDLAARYGDASRPGCAASDADGRAIGRAPEWIWWGIGVPWLGGVTGNPAGDVYVLTSGPEFHVSLDRLMDGHAEVVRTFPITGNNALTAVFRSSPNLLHGHGDTLFVGVTGFVGLGDVTYVDLGAGPRTGAQTVELREDGSFVSTVLSCCTEYFESTQWVEDVDDHGNLLVGQWSTTAAGTKLVRADGRELLLSSFNHATLEREGLETGCDSPRFTPDDGVVCGGRAVVKIDLDGAVLWRTTFRSSNAHAAHVGVTLDGRIVVAGPTGTLLDSECGFVATLTEGGTILWTRNVAPAPQALAVHPAGRAAMLLSDDWRLIGTMGRADVLVMSGDGAVEQRSPLAPAERISFAADEVVVAGTVAPGVHDLGHGPVTVDARSVFAVSFAP